MTTPPYLKHNDEVAIIAPAKRIEVKYIENAIYILKQWGLNVVMGQHLFSGNEYLAGNDQQRLSDLQEAINNPNIKAIFCARGGYGTLPILAHLDLSALIENPKWILGFSDITALHCHCMKQSHTESIHAMMPLNFPDKFHWEESPAMIALKKTITGNPLRYNIPQHPLNREGEASGIIVGGNLTVLCSLLGSDDFPDTKNTILFLEDVDESAYAIDRHITQLHRHGVFQQINGLIIGAFTDISDNTNGYSFGLTAEEIIHKRITQEKYPVCYNFPAGHISENFPIILGREITMIVPNGGDLSINFLAKTDEKQENNSSLSILRISLITTLLFISISLLYHFLLPLLLK